MIAEQSKLSNGIVVSFNVDRESIGKLIGTGGANIRAAQRMPGVPFRLHYGAQLLTDAGASRNKPDRPFAGWDSEHLRRIAREGIRRFWFQTIDI